MKGKRLIEELTQVIQSGSDLPISYDCEKNHPLYFISSPVLREIQKANSKNGGRSDYRTGISVSCYTRGLDIGISTYFSPGLLENFKRNSSQKEVEVLIKKILNLGAEGAISWDSNRLYKEIQNLSKAKKSSEGFAFYSGLDSKLVELYDDLAESKISSTNWLSDVGCKPTSSGKGLRIVNRGSRFQLLFYFIYSEKREIIKTAELLTPWLAKFLPEKSKRSRDANLRRTLLKKSKKIICAHKGCSIQNLDELAAGHIKPHSKGGSDHFTNGIWLCKEHHLKQEGRPTEWHKKNLKKLALKSTVIGVRSKL